MPRESPELSPSNGASAEERAASAEVQKKGFSVTHTSFSAPPVDFRAGELSPYVSSHGATPPTHPRSPSRSHSAMPMSPLGELPASAMEARTIEDIEASTSSRGSSPAGARMGTSPRLAASAPKTGVAVPLITPRYQKKSRTNRAMEVSNSLPDHQLPSQVLGQRTTEMLTVHNGPQQYQQQMEFRTYDVYKQGKHKIFSRSVGYSSDGDLVMTKEELSEPSDVDLGYNRKQTEIHPPTVLDRSARRPLTDTELQSKRKIRINRPRYKKYPGILAPRDRKKLNRLHNEQQLHAFANHLRARARDERAAHAPRDDNTHNDEDDDDDDDDDHERRAMAPSHPTTSFTDMPPAMRHALDMKDNRQEEELIRIGALRARGGNHLGTGKDPRGSEARFQQLNLRLRGELQHALGSAFLARQIEDLEACFVHFIKAGPTTRRLVFHFRDGYGRLVCHGVSAYYLLQSESKLSENGEKMTLVSFPGTRKKVVKEIALPYTSLMSILRRKSKNMPAHHSLSASNSPAITPQQSPQVGPSPAPSSTAPAGSPMTPLALSPDEDYPADEAARTEALWARCQTAFNTTVFFTDESGELILPFAKMPIYDPQNRIDASNYADVEDGPDATQAELV